MPTILTLNFDLNLYNSDSKYLDLEPLLLTLNDKCIALYKSCILYYKFKQ